MIHIKNTLRYIWAVLYYAPPYLLLILPHFLWLSCRHPNHRSRALHALKAYPKAALETAVDPYHNRLRRWRLYVAKDLSWR